MSSGVQEPWGSQRKDTTSSWIFCLRRNETGSWKIDGEIGTNVYLNTHTHFLIFTDVMGSSYFLYL